MMAFSSATQKAIFDAIKSTAEKLGLFDRVAEHEPRNAPGNGLSLAIWAGPLTPAGRVSGLAATSGRFEVMARVYAYAESRPFDGTDPAVSGAAADLMGALSGQFTIGGDAMEIDLLGAYGTPLSSTPGYVQQDGKPFRVAEITIPVIVPDIWGQAE